MERTTLEEYARKKGLQGPVPDAAGETNIVILNRSQKKRRSMQDVYPTIKK